MNCKYCKRVIRKRTVIGGRPWYWEHESDSCQACDPDNQHSEIAEPDWEDLIGGFGRKMNELAKSNVGRAR